MSIVARTPDHAPDIAVALPKTIVARAFVEETVLLDINSGRYFRLDGTAAQMLDALTRHGTVGAAARALCEDGWGVQGEVAGDLSAFCTELERLGVLTTRGVG